MPKIIKVKDKQGNEVEIDIEKNSDVLAMVNEARKEEKTKLYGKQQTLEATIKTLNNKIKSLEDEDGSSNEELDNLKKQIGKLEKTAEDYKAEIDKLREDEEEEDEENTKSKKKSGGLSKKEVQEMLKATLEDEKKNTSAEVTALKAEIAKLQGNLSTQNVEQYTKEKLKEYEEVLIADFVPKNLKTTEEVDEAIKTAIEKSSTYLRTDYTYKDDKGNDVTKNMSLSEVEKFEKELEEKRKEAVKKRNYKNTETLPNPPENIQYEEPQALVGKMMDGNMTDEEFAKNRDTILAEIKNSEKQ